MYIGINKAIGSHKAQLAAAILVVSAGTVAADERFPSNQYYTALMAAFPHNGAAAAAQSKGRPRPRRALAPGARISRRNKLLGPRRPSHAFIAIAVAD
jgi:hypothetical protein